jgi:chemotaxis protein methyltransferase CheR
MEIADLGNAPVSRLPIPRTRLGGVEGSAKRDESSAETICETRFQHVHFRGASSAGRELKKPAVVVRPVSLPPPARPQPAEDAATLFLRQILMQAGLNPLLYRTAPLIRRLPACLRALRVDTCSAAERLLATKPALVPKALESLLIGTTELFRDPAVFARLEQEVLPKLLLRLSRPRIWSAGCSEGAELYSVAMLMAKLGGLNGSLLLGSDCRQEAIERAKRGVYPLGERALPAHATKHCLQRPDGRIAISHELRQAVTWEQNDLLASRSLGTWDLILCRNLAIYLEPVAAEVLWMRLAEAIAPGGYLIVGKAEKPRVSSLRRVAPSIYCKCTRLQTSS